LTKKILLTLSLFLISVNITTAQFFFFGRNKVTYEDFEWKLLKTEHFDIYYSGEFLEIAEIGAQYAEEAFDEYKVKFNNIITRRIPLVFYNSHLQFQQTNIVPNFIPEGVGGFFEFLKGRVVIPYLGSLEQFRHVIRHELVHVFMTSKLFNLQRDRRIAIMKQPPLWFIEGLAEYWSYHWDTQAEMILRDAVLNGYFIPLKEMLKIYGTFLMYKEGQNFLMFVGEEYGEEKVLLMLENIWRFSSFEKVIEYTLEESIDEIDEKWSHSLKQKYFPLYENKYPHTLASKKITSEGFNFSPAIYQDNEAKEIYFIGNYDGYASVFKIEFDDTTKSWSEPIKIVQGEKEEVFEAFHLLQLSLTASSDGKVAFVSKAGGSDAIHIYSIGDEEVIQTYKWDDLITIQSPSFSNDNNKLVFNATDKKGYSDIFIFDLSLDSLFRITNDYYDDLDPIFTKNDNHIIFSSDRTEGYFEGKSNLFKIGLSTFEIEYLTYVNANIKTPHFNPDFSELYFTSDYDGVFNIWKLENENANPIGMKQYSHFVTSVYDFDFFSNNEVVTSSFQKFSLQFYEYDMNSVPDSAKKYVKFNFALRDKPWIAKKIELESEFKEVDYKKEYSLDYAVGQFAAGPSYGERAGALMTFSDMLGDDKYYFLFYNSGDFHNDIFRNINVALTRLYVGERTNYAYGVFHFNGPRYDIRVSDDRFYERVYGGFFSLIYPLSFFKRLEVSVSLANSDRELLPGVYGRKSLQLTNMVSFVHDNSLWGPSGPLDGSRYRFLLGYTSDIKYSNTNYFTAVMDYRHYLRLGFRSALAFRGSIYYNEGKDATRYIAGGSWDLRGWPRWGIRGEKLWISSAELRFPLIDELTIRFPFLGISFSQLRGAVFFDAGGAWDDAYNETLGSIGAGIRFNFFNAIVFRYDVGKKIENNFTKFQDTLFYQFFFGWDF
jgi:Tol biopolymer transport system component